MTDINISTASVLASFNCSVYTGRKLDKNVSKDVANDKGAQSASVGRYHKDLFSGEPLHQEIMRIVSEARRYHASITLPWDDGGARLLPAEALFDYNDEMNRYANMFDRAVDAFIADYDNLISKAAFKLGSLFNRLDYPTKHEARQKFSFATTFTPVPTAGDFRVDVGNTALQMLRDQFEGQAETRLNAAMRDAWDRLHEMLSRIVDRLGHTDGKPNVFRDSMVEGALELVSTLKYLNITKDMRLEKARQQLEEALRGVQPDDLRRDDSVRETVRRRAETTAADVKAILDKFDF